MGIDSHELSLCIGLFGGEPWDESVRQEIEDRLSIKAFDVYGLAELGGPGVSFECEQRDGLHIAEDQFLVEVIDPDSGQVLEPGQSGELVFTTVNKEAFPLLRYRSGDLSSLNAEPCPCGRTHARMNRVSQYTDGRIVVRGINIFPGQVEGVLAEIDGLGKEYQLVLDRTTARERLEVHVELSPDSTPDQMRRLIGMQGQIKDRLQQTLGLAVEVKLVEPGSIGPGADRLRIIDK